MVVVVVAMMIVRVTVRVVVVAMVIVGVMIPGDQPILSDYTTMLWPNGDA